MNKATNKVLNGLPVLLTRPQGQAQDWSQQLQSLGAHVAHIPTLAIQPLAAPDETENLLKRADFGVFVSGNAVRALMKVQVARGFSVDTVWYCVGKATETLAAELGFAVTASCAVDSETLLQNPLLRDVNGKHCVIVRGQGGRTVLGDTLAKRGAHVDYCELYRRDGAWQNAELLASYLAGKASAPHVIIASSVDSLNYTFLLAEKREMRANVEQATILVPGKRVADAALQLGARHVLCAGSIQLVDIVAELERWWAKQQ